MRKIHIIIFVLTSITAWGQEQAVGKVYVDGQKLKTVACGTPYFEFVEHDTILTPKGKQYLDEFGRIYRDSLSNKQKYLIELAPGLTEKEREKNWDLGTKRVMAVINYLEHNYGINKRDFRARYSQTITKDGCVGFLLTEKNSRKLTKKEKRKLKKEEDNYFKD